MKLFIILILSLLGTAYTTEILCNIKTDNVKSYMCPTLYSSLYSSPAIGDPAVTDTCTNHQDYYANTQLACVQDDYEGTTDVTLDWSGGCTNIDASYVIKCFLYASIGQTAGACSQLNSTQEDCHFEDGAEFEELPESLGDQCIGQAECDIKVSTSGWQISTDGGSTYSNPVAYTSLANGVNKLKFLVACGPAAEDYSTTAMGQYKECTLPEDDAETENSSILNVQILTIFITLFVFLY